MTHDPHYHEYIYSIVTNIKCLYVVFINLNTVWMCCNCFLHKNNTDCIITQRKQTSGRGCLARNNNVMPILLIIKWRNLSLFILLFSDKGMLKNSLSTVYIRYKNCVFGPRRPMSFLMINRYSPLRHFSLS